MNNTENKFTCFEVFLFFGEYACSNLRDIALYTPEPAFTGKSVRYITSDEHTMGEIATVLGTAIGKPDLQWIEFTDEQALNGTLQAGLPPGPAKNFVEMGTTIRSGILWEDYDAKGTQPTGTIKLEDFANEFAERYADFK